MAKKDKTQDQLVNLQAAQLAAQTANWAAQLEFQKERMRLLELPQFQFQSQQAIDELAFKKAQDTWQRAIQEASVTGTYNGVPTVEWLTQQAQITGVLNGQQTLQGKLTDAQIAQMNASMVNTQRLTDLEYSKFGFQREQWDAEHQMALEKQQADLTGYINGLPTFEREQWDANHKLAVANLISSLSGPASAFKQVAVIRNLTGVEPTIGGVTQALGDVLRGGRPSVASFGQGTGGAEPANPYSPYYAQPQPQQQAVIDTIPLTGKSVPVAQAAPTGIPYQGPSLAAMTGQSTPTDTTTPQSGGAALPYSFNPAGTPAPVDQYNYEHTNVGGTNVYPPGVPAPTQQAQASTPLPLGPGQQQRMAQAAAQTSSPTVGYAGPGLLPSQINAANFNKLTNYEKEMTWAGFENGEFGSGAWDKQLAQELYQRSLPKYAGPATQTGKVVL